MNKRYLLTLLLSCLSLLAWANRIDQQIAQEMAQTVAQSYQEGSLRTSTQSRMPNAPTDARYLSSIGELMMDTDNPSLPPITLKENKLTDCYLNVASELNDVYNEAKVISIDMSGQSGDKTMRFQIQDYDHWRGHLRVWYKNEMFYESQYATELLSIDDNGVFTINLEDGTYESSHSTYLLLGSDRRGTLRYDMEILDDNTGSSQCSITNGTICFIQELATQISPNTITGPAGTAIPVIATLSNIDPVLYGKAADVIIVVSPISNPNIQIQYKGTTIEGIFAYFSVVVPIRIEALPDASSLEIPFTLQSAEEIPSGAEVNLLSYVSGFQGNWGHSPLVITPAEPKSYSIHSYLTGLSLATESETVLPGGTYEGVLSVTDAVHTKLPLQISIKVADSEEPWNDFGYDPRTGSIVIRNITAELVIQAAAEPFQSYSITTQLQNMDITGLPEGNTIQEGQSLRFTLSAHEPYRLPATIQVKQNGEALSTEAYTYNSTSGEVVIPSVQGNITIVASAIGEDSHEVLLQLTNLTSTLETTSFSNNSPVAFVLNANSGYTLPATLTVTLGETALTAGEGYTYEPTTGQFSLAAITGTLSITGTADPEDYGEADFNLSHLTVEADHTEKAIHGLTYECQLTADEGYDLPNSVQIEMNDTPLRAGYTYENGLIRILSVTGPVKITAAATLKTYSVTTQLENLTCESPHKVEHGKSLTVYFKAAEGYSLPLSVSVQMNGTTLTEGYIYVDGILIISSVTGPVEITASAISGMVINETEKEVEGTISAIHVETDGSASLTLQSLNTNLMEISSNSDAHLIVATNSQIQSLNNSGKVKLESVGDAALQLQSIDNSGELVLDESLKLSAVPQSIDNEGIFMDNTGMITQVSGPSALGLMPLPAQSSYTQGETHSLTVKARIAAEWVKIIFKWQKKQSDGWVEVKSEEIEPFSLRSDGLIELTSTYDLPLNESGTYRCVVTNFKSEEIQTTLFTETSVTVNTPDPEPDPTPDPIILYRVTIPQVEGATVLTYGSMYVEEWEDFSFRIHIQEGYDATNMSVEANGTVLLPDARGLYTIEHITDNVTVTITGIVKETPTSIDTIGADATAVWTSRGQIHIRLGQEATVTVLNYSGRLVKLFKGSAGDYAIPVQAGSYIVTINGRVYKVVQ